MYKNILLSASVMCMDWFDIKNQMSVIEKSEIDYLHFDIIDGYFAHDFTMGSSIIDVFRQNSKLPSDYHLMVEEPARIFDTFNANKFDNITIHQETSRNLHRNIMSLKNKKVKVGVALCPATPISTLEYILDDIDLIIIMTVNPGFKGQPLVPQALRKISDLKKIINKMKLKTKISVDGYVNSNTIPEMVSAGADILVLGSTGLFQKNKSIQESIIEIKQGIDKGLR